jgi:hypothetical protein
MTEKWWLTCAAPNRMLNYLRASGLSERKDILFGSACCRRILHLVGTGGPGALEAVERFAEAPSDRPDLRAALFDELWPAGELLRETGVAGDRLPAGAEGERRLLLAREYAATAFLYFSHIRLNPDVALTAWMAQAVQATRAGRRRESAAQAALLRDIAGNPFRPVTVSPVCLTPQVVALAQAAYEERELPAGTLDLARLAVLADALEEAGCDQLDLLVHLRGAGLHVRGCWAVDLILGKE